jgi:DnaJ-class molecular chaperone
MDLPVTVGEAVSGATISVPTPDGPVRLHVPPQSQSGRQLRVRGKGVAAAKGMPAGDLYLRLLIQVPDAGTEAVRSAVDVLEAGYTRSPREGFNL